MAYQKSHSCFLILGMLTLHLCLPATAQEKPRFDRKTFFQTFADKTAVVNGLKIHYVIGGKGEPVVLLHGYPETWYDWRKVMPALAKKYTVIVPDMRGLGKSEKPADGDYTKKTVADDVYKLVQSLGYKSVKIAAQDMGGPVAISYAGMHSEEVSKLVFIESGIGGYGIEAAMDTSKGGSWHFGLFADTEIALLLTKGHEREFFTRWAYRGKYVVDKATFTDDDISEYLKYYTAPGGMAAGFGYYKAFAQDAKDNRILFAGKKLPMPILAVGGDHSFGDSGFKNLQPISTNVRGVVIKDCGHFVNEEQPEALAKLLLLFFEEP